VKLIIKLVLAGTLATAAAASGADLAILRNGNAIRHERREVVGAVTRLYLSDTSSGYIEIPTDQIERFEKDTAPSPPKRPVGASSSATSPAVRQFQQQVPAQATTLTRQGLGDVINGAGERHQIDPDFINSVIRAESGFHQNAVSRKGAQGLMQLMPGTASELGVANPFDPKANVEGGTTYLRELLEKYNFDVPKALAAYNAGSKRVDQYHGVPPYYETQAYIARIIRDFNRQKLAENPALARTIKSSAQRSEAARQSVPKVSSRVAKATANASKKPKTAFANSLAQDPQTASR
jgi:transglycosylase-like protein with SLT domain